MAVIAVRVMRSSKNKTVNMGVALAAALSLGSGVGGVHLISEAVAGGVIITNPNGQTRNIFEGFNPVFNDSGTLQRVTEISLNSGCTQVFESERNGGFALRANGGSVGTCSVSPSTELPDGSTCEIIVDCGGLNGGNNGGNGGLMNGGIGDT